MSFEPDIWIKKSDLFDTGFDITKWDVWPYEIAGIEGLVLAAGELSSSHHDLHNELYKKNIVHYLLNGEGERCELCKGWQDQIHEYISENQ